MTQKTEILFNGECPICSREVGHYARLCATLDADVRFDDLSDPERLTDWGLDAAQAAKRFHLRRGGVVLSGVPAFAALWHQIPRYRWLARMVELPVVHGAACLLYDYVLAPLLYGLHLVRRWRKRRHNA